MLRQQRSAVRLRRFDRAIFCGYGILATVLLLRLVFGDALGLPKLAQLDGPARHAPLASVTAPISSMPAMQIAERGAPQLVMVHSPAAAP
jgi:hypothetical protein